VSGDTFLITLQRAATPDAVVSLAVDEAMSISAFIRLNDKSLVDLHATVIPVISRESCKQYSQTMRL